MRSGLIRGIPATPKPTQPTATTTTKMADSSIQSTTSSTSDKIPPDTSSLTAPPNGTVPVTQPLSQEPPPTGEQPAPSSTSVSDKTEAPILNMENMANLPLQEQMALMGQMMCAINITLSSVNSTLRDLQVSNTNIKEDFTRLKTEVNTDVVSKCTTIESKLDALEKKLTEDHYIRITEALDEIKTIKATHSVDPDSISELKAHRIRQDQSIEDLKDKLEDKEDRMLILEQMLKDHIDATDTRLNKVEEGVDEAIEMANQVEAHERRWAIRAIGLPAPVNKTEKTPETKAVILAFLADKLNIKNIDPADIDCAHRLGTIKEKKQTLLVRFFRREIVEHILFNKKMLKGSEVSLFEDTTVKNRTLIYDLNQRAEVEIAWNQSGKIWAKLYNVEKRIRVKVTENLDTVLAKYPAASLPSTQPKRPHSKKKPDTTVESLTNGTSSPSTPIHEMQSVTDLTGTNHTPEDTARPTPQAATAPPTKPIVTAQTEVLITA